MIYEHGGNVHKASRDKKIDIDKIIDFSANINPLGLSEKGTANLIRNINGIINYPDPDYFHLKQGICEYNNINFENIFLGNGAIDSLFFLIRYLNSDIATIIAPSFIEYERSLNTTCTKINYFYLKEEDNFNLNVEEFFSSVERSNSDLIIICNPNNPTGNIIKIEEIEKILLFCKNKNVKVILDEAFMDFVDYNEENSAINFINQNPNLFILRSLTKFFAIPGLRLGYTINSSEEYNIHYKTFKEPWSINYLADKYAVEAICDEDYIKNTKDYIAFERKKMVNTLNMIKGIKAYKSYGNFIFLKYEKTQNLRNSLYDRNILIRSCENYRGLDSNYFRIAVKSRNDNSKLIKALKEICEDNND